MPDRALADFATMTRERPHQDPPSPFAPGVLLYVVDAQLAAGDLDAAVDSTRQATALAGRLPTALAQDFCRHLAPFADHPQIRDVLETLPRCDDRAPAPAAARS